MTSPLYKELVARFKRKGFRTDVVQVLKSLGSSWAGVRRQTGITVTDEREGVFVSRFDMAVDGWPEPYGMKIVKRASDIKAVVHWGTGGRGR